jgi:antitoxin CcdA
MLKEHIAMAGRPKRKTTVMLHAYALDCAKDLQIDVSALAEAALLKAIAEARDKKWVEENTDAFAAQADWHERNGHPLAEIIAAPGGDAWNS